MRLDVEHHRDPAIGTLDPALTPVGAYERHMLRTYAERAMRPSRGGEKVKILESLATWYVENRKTIGLRLDHMDRLMERGLDWDVLPGFVSVRCPRAKPTTPSKLPPASALQRRLDWIAATLRLDPMDAALLAAVSRLTLVPRFAALAEATSPICRSDGEVAADIATRLGGGGPRDIRRLVGSSSPLVQLGLVEDRGGGDVAISATVLSVVSRRGTSDAALKSVLLGTGQHSSLAPSDFEHLGEARDRAVAIIRGALAAGEPGTAVLLHGPPGTGKTEFARLLGTLTGARTVFIGETGSEAGARLAEPSRADRLSHLAFASALAERAGRVLLVMDEADDVFTGVDDGEMSNRTGSKVFMNRLVEACAAPTVWITNHPERLGASVLRRMLLAVEFRPADRTTRLKVVRRHAKAQGVELTGEEVERLAGVPASPAVLRTSIRAARLGAGAPGERARTAVATATSILRAMGERELPEPPPGSMPFDAALSNSDADLAEIQRRVAAAGRVPLSFLFHGLPGTGKSAFARHLAGVLGMEVLERRGSDILGMYVGETEKRIAGAFVEAADTRRFLLLDEADSLLGDRAGAQRSWEVSSVNEMLSWMERHPMPFAATTNLFDRLDPATHRRFVFKARFDPMTPTQISEAFRRYFGREAPASVTRLAPLTPGDFSIVARRACLLGIDDPVAIGSELGAEVAIKPGGGGRMGF